MYLLDGPPFKKDLKTGKVYDRRGTEIGLFKGSKKALKLFLDINEEINKNKNNSEYIKQYSNFINKFNQVKFAYCSRTTYPKWADKCLDLIEINSSSNKLYTLKQCAKFFQIFPGDKKTHFKNISKQSNENLNEMIFYDNERRNCIRYFF